jgi:hypothetical protein
VDRLLSEGLERVSNGGNPRRGRIGVRRRCNEADALQG